MCLGIPGRVLEVIADEGGMPMGKVEFGGIVKDICLAYVPDVQPGQYVLVHVGFAISQIDEAEAEEIFSYLQQIEDTSEWAGEPGPVPSAEPLSDEAGT